MSCTYDLPMKPHAGERARNTLWYLFFLMGVVSMAWVPRIPEIKTELHLSDGRLGFLLLGSTCGAVIGSQLAGRLIHIFGSRILAIAGSAILSLGLIAMSASHHIPQLFVGLFVMGTGYVTLDISVNTQALSLIHI